MILAMNSNLKLILFILFISFTIIGVTGCLEQSPGDSPVGNDGNAKYYTGKTGVKSSFENLPSTVYYYEDATPDENAFDFLVSVHNTGTSLTRGATFISGYNPDFIEIEGQELVENQGWGDCTFDLTGFGDTFGDWFGDLACTFTDGGSFQYTQHGEDARLNVNNVGALGEDLGLWTVGENSLIDMFSFGLDANLESGITGVSFDFDYNDVDVGLLYHGWGFVSFLAASGLNFGRVLGREYLLEADDSNHPGGALDYIDYHASLKTWPPASDQFNLDLMLTNCYAYVTYASPLVCIDPMPESQQRKVCKPRSITFPSAGTGAPVAVTKIEQENSKKKAIFTIHVKNVGKGEVIEWGKLERCSPYYPSPLLIKDKNILHTSKLIRIGNQILDCTPKETVRLDDRGEGVITCTYDLAYTNFQSAYEAPLVMEFWYGYQETEIKSVLFKKG